MTMGDGEEVGLVKTDVNKLIIGDVNNRRGGYLMMMLNYKGERARQESRKK